MSGSSEDDENNFWECDACRCHTNTETSNPVSCGVCGTRRRVSFRAGSGVMGDNVPSSYRRSNLHRYGIGLMQNPEGGPYRINEEQSSDSSSCSMDQECVSEEQEEAQSHAQAMNEDEARIFLDQVTSASNDRPEYTLQWNSQYKGSRIRVLDSMNSDETTHGKIALMTTEQGKAGVDSCVRANTKISGRECFGWKIVFEYTSRDVGKSMGGCYLVGVVSHKLSDYSERLQDSNYFYGIEDGGRHYEGSKNASVSNGLQLSRKDAPRNSENVLFGNREVITVVADMKERNLTFWRDDKFLGTLIRNLPEDEDFYPVAAPFNSGVCVVISSLRDDPLSILSSYHKGLCKKRVAKRQEILRRKEILIKNGCLTTELVHVLMHIFSWYQDCQEHNDIVDKDSGMKLNLLEASRLWYRCGIHLSGLMALVKARKEAADSQSTTDAIFVHSKDFIDVIRQIVADEEDRSPVIIVNGNDSDFADSQSLFQVGDTVEVFNHLDDYYGCNSGGHLLPGDRGVVIEVVKHKPSLVRVKYAGKRSTYRGADIASERSGLIVCSAVDFLSAILHAHGYSSDLQPLWGKQVEKNICKDGDLIARKISDEAIVDDPFRILGRISLRPNEFMKKASIVNVRFFNRDIDLRAENLLFTTFFHRQHPRRQVVNTTDRDIDLEDDTAEPKNESYCMDGISDHFQKKVELVAKADKRAILTVTKDCKDPMKISSFFSAGLHLSISSAIEWLSKSTTNDGSVVALLNLALVFVKGIYDNAPNEAKMALTSPIQQQGNSHNLAERDIFFEISDIQNTNILAMERLLSSALRGEHGADIRELMRDVGSGSDRRRNVLLALIAGTRSEDLDYSSNASNDASLSQPALYDQLVGDNNPRILNRSHLPMMDSSVPAIASKSTTSQLCRRGTSSTGRDTRISAGTRSLIHDGLLVNSISWVRRALRNGADVNCLDEEGNSIIFLSVAVGCEVSIVKALVCSGATVSRKEVEYAAQTDQLKTLDFLLKYVSYEKTETEIFSKAVREVFDATERRQLLLRADISKAAPKYVSQIFLQIMKLGLVYHHAKKKDNCRMISDVLVGDVLLHAVVKNQGVVDCYSNDKLNDIRAPVLPGTTSLKRGFLDIVPTEIIADTFKEEDTLKAYLRLTESYLWSKEISSIAAGLTLACKLIERDPSHCRQISRFGFKELANDHKALASNILLDLCDPDMMKDEFEVKCAKKHKAIIHLTKHSQFRCDLCGRGVEQGKPMHGCRQCDWDACELCTDKAQGGIAKWNYVRNIAEEFLSLYSEHDTHQNCSVISKEVHEIASYLRARELSSIEELGSLLNSEETNSLFEFSSAILPPLFSAIVPFNGSIIDQSQLSRRNKKARVGMTLQNSENHAGWRKQLMKVLLRDPQRNMLSDAKKVRHNNCEEYVSASAVSRQVKNIYEKRGVAVKGEVSNIIRCIHTVLAFKENAHVRSFKESSLQSLLEPLTISLVCAQGSPIAKECKQKHSTIRANPKPSFSLSENFNVHAEPLMPYADFRRHILRCCPVKNQEYLNYCRRLALDRAIIAERPQSFPESISVRQELANKRATNRKIAKVVSYHEETGAHVVRYASQLSSVAYHVCVDESIRENLEFSSGEVLLLLASRDYCILNRDVKNGEPSKVECDERNCMEVDKPFGICEESINGGAGQRFLSGSRVECDVNSNCVGKHFTVISATMDSAAASKVDGLDSNYDSSDDYLCSESSPGWWYNLVSDEGEVALQVPDYKIRGSDSKVEKASHLRVGSQERIIEYTRGNTSQHGSATQDVEYASIYHSGRKNSSTGVMKRCWSAISLANDMKSLEISVQNAENTSSLRQPTKSTKKLSIGSTEFDFDLNSVEMPPLLSVELSMDNDLDPIPLEMGGSTLFNALQKLSSMNKRRKKDFLRSDYRLFYKVSIFQQENLQITGKAEAIGNMHLTSRNACKSIGSEIPKISSCPLEDVCRGHFDGLDVSSIMCLKLLNAFSDEVKERAKKPEEEEALSSSLVSEVLTKKLLSQLEDPLSTVSGSLPSWCWAAPMASPATFSYESRKLLLERTAFGVSRAVLRQQEAKVAVESLRERMTVLRGRAVALVGEAFSGGAADPTALQLQADEIYGMEEALAARVAAAFRAQNWEEQSLLCVKAAVRRTELLKDAASVMEQYSSDYKVRRRRLEVRFEGESGFDAASGTEAGVTRGFYADVAEALSSCDNVLTSTSLVFAADTTFAEDEMMHHPLPLWISDVDESNQIIVPTPRADPSSEIGIYPRPLAPGNPWKSAVLKKFRFIGRLFAAALRDGFVFPLPLSSSFLKLVQGCTQNSSTQRRPSNSSGSSIETGLSSSPSSAGSSQLCQRATEEGACIFENTRVFESNEFYRNIPNTLSSTDVFDSKKLSSKDLPRPGFLGGEVFAVEAFICSKLDEINGDSGLSEQARVCRRQQIANNPSFSRNAFGKAYDCSFTEYFDGKIFVDPLDPSQDGNAHPLCVDFDRSVTIDNVQEWVRLSKHFILYDGVIAQAKAFRQGIEDFFPAESLNLLSSRELQSYVCGTGDSVDLWNEEDIRALLKLDGGKGAAEALVAVAAMGGEGGAALSRRFGPNSPTIGYLVRALLEAEIKERRQFLSFITSVPIVTPGKIEVVPIVSPMGDFLPMKDPSCLPRSNTCARRLYVPKFDNYEMFSKVFWAVVKEESRFKGFYEWRG